MECLACITEFEPDEFPFGSNVVCPHCGAELATDWDYVDEDYSAVYWITHIVKKGGEAA